MRLSEKGILASLAFFLLALSVVGQARIFDSKGSVLSPSSWQAEVGLYLPFVLFALISTYHFLEWAKKHRKQAIVMMVFMVCATSLIGTATLNIPRQAANTVTIALDTTSQQVQESPIPIPQQPTSLQETVLKLQQVLSETPYFSLSFNVVLIATSALAVAIVVLRMRPRVRHGTVGPLNQTEDSSTSEKTPREYVIQCYCYAVAALQKSGFRIPDSDTPSDAYVRVRQLRPTIADAYWQLVLLFEEAKFSLHSISDNQADSAHIYCDAISNSESLMLQ
jgi:hypothetical protein